MLWDCHVLDKKNIGAEEHSYSEPKSVIIDCQQRLTSLYAVIKGKAVTINSFSFINEFNNNLKN